MRVNACMRTLAADIQALYHDLVTDLQGGKTFPLTQADCHNTIQLLHAFYCSDEKQQWIDVQAQAISQRLGRPNEGISMLYRCSVM